MGVYARHTPTRVAIAAGVRVAVAHWRLDAGVGTPLATITGPAGTRQNRAHTSVRHYAAVTPVGLV